MKYIKANWPAPPCVKAFTTLREGWFGRDERLSTLLPIPSEPIWLNQQHTAFVVDAAAVKNNDIEPIADACFTTLPNQVCAVLTADCLPILISNRQGTHVAAIHGGWRGLAKGVLESTLAALAISPEDTIVWLGPAIGPKKFEVGDDVYQAFTTQHPESARAFYPHAGKWLADLYTLAKIRLNLHGILQVFGGDFCTYTQKDMFYSYRREKDQTGHMATLIWISGSR